VSCLKKTETRKNGITQPVSASIKMNEAEKLLSLSRPELSHLL